ncbi:hypothetical protein BDA99DRAFT_608054 [Phascolomyces articulosus]|uniref:Uncharacterized protein n=1 Tax=Phascolomyces articulosus TaxID=60185 RepID=A0AAD5JSC5_9FUNG|nr:hypothetical protein BDA99DRAFT_608054 [Phascolomyces articulosus]
MSLQWLGFSEALAKTFSDIFHFDVSETLRKNLGKAFFKYLEVAALAEQELVAVNNLVTQEKGCPGCPMNCILIALDSSMQLTRRKAKENDKKEIKHDTSLDCESDFKAIKNKPHSPTNCHEKGLVGSICARHDILLEFTNIYQPGEKFMYAISIIDALLNQYPSIKIDTIMYDTCCRVEPTLKMNVNGYLSGYIKASIHATFDKLNENDTKFSVSVFHAFSHNIQCQIRYNPRYMEGLGLSDGEEMERLWSCLSKFVTQTRQMTAKNRMLTLCHAIEHFKAIRIADLYINTFQNGWKKFVVLVKRQYIDERSDEDKLREKYVCALDIIYSVK